MKRTWIASAALALLVTVAGCRQPAKSGAAEDLERERAVTRTLMESLLDGWLPGMGAENVAERESPQRKFEELCFSTSGPGHEAARVVLCEVIVGRLGPATAKPARVWLLRQLECIGQGECVAAVAELLEEEDGEIRDAARRALQRNSSAAAAAALRAELEKTTDPAWQIALLNALGARRDAAALPQFARFTGHADVSVASAAIAALGELGGGQAIDALLAVWNGRDLPRRQLAAVALLRAADRLVEGGERGRAAQIYVKLDNPVLDPSLRAGALRGLALTDSRAALPRVVELMQGKRVPALTLVAARMLGEMPGDEATRALVDELPNLPVEVQVVVVDALGGRSGAAVKPAIVRCFTSADERVRIAAIGALQRVGDVADIVVLGNVAAGSEGAERDAARLALARLKGAEIDPVILADVKDARPPLRAELIRALAARRYREALPTLIGEVRHPDEAVRVAAFNALGELSMADDAPVLVGLVASVEGEAALAAAEDAAVAVCGRIEPEAKRAEPVLAVWQGAAPAARVPLLRVLGRIGGAAALNQIRAARTGADVDVADAAVRALAKWPTAEVLDDLLDSARNAESKTLRVLALQGYVRLLGLPSERETRATVELYRTAMALAERPEEQKLVLGGLGSVPGLEALRLAQASVEEEALRNEAQAAVMASARLIGPSHGAEALAAVEGILEQASDEALQKRGQEALDAIRKCMGCIVDWQIAGPYFEEGKDLAAILDVAFPAEDSEAEGVEWRPLRVTDPAQPWVFDLTKLDKGGSRCVYVRSAVWCEAAQDARLEVGSDDAVKVWLNGRLVHQFRGVRSHQALQDRLPVTLAAGWNTVRLKVVQGDGGWAFSCAFRGPEGGPLAGVKCQAEVPAAPQAASGFWLPAQRY